MATASWVPGYTWDAGERVSTLQDLSPLVFREEFVVGFFPLDNPGLPGGWSRGKEETNTMRVAFDIYLKGLSFVVKRHDYCLTLYSLISLGAHNILEGVFIVLPSLQEKN